MLLPKFLESFPSNYMHFYIRMLYFPAISSQHNGITIVVLRVRDGMETVPYSLDRGLTSCRDDDCL